MATVCLWVQMEARVFQIISGLSRIREKKKKKRKVLAKSRQPEANLRHFTWESNHIFKLGRCFIQRNSHATDFWAKSLFRVQDLINIQQNAEARQTRLRPCHLEPCRNLPRSADPTALSDISRRVLIKSRVFSLPGKNLITTTQKSVEQRSVL